MPVMRRHCQAFGNFTTTLELLISWCILVVNNRSESGSRTAVVTQNQITDEYDISIDPTLMFASQSGTNNLSVYGDDVLSGTISYNEVPLGGIIAMPDESATDMMLYTVDDGIYSFSEIDEWLFPVDCDDKSSMNRRDLCDARR